MKYYKEQLTSDKLPNKEGKYFCKFKGKDGLVEHLYCVEDDFTFKYWKNNNIEYWIEPIEISSNIDEILPDKDRYMTLEDEEPFYYMDDDEQFKLLNNYIKAFEQLELRVIELEVQNEIIIKERDVLEKHSERYFRKNKDLEEETLNLKSILEMERTSRNIDKANYLETINQLKQEVEYNKNCMKAYIMSDKINENERYNLAFNYLESKNYLPNENNVQEESDLIVALKLGVYGKKGNEDE